MITHTGTQTIETERLILRRFEYSDIDSMLRNWIDDEKNPTIKLSVKKKKKGKSKEIITTSKKVDSFFNIFDTKDKELRKDLIEAQFFRNDFYKICSNII